MCWCCPWEASRMTRKQICKFCNFGVAHLHTHSMCICQGYLHGSTGPGRWRFMIWSHPHTRKGVKCCCTVLGKWGLLAGGTHQIWTGATSLHEVLPAGKRRETWEVWVLSLELSLNAATLSLFTARVFDAFPLQVTTLHNTVRHKLQKKSIQVWFIWLWFASDFSFSFGSTPGQQILVCNAHHTVRQWEKRVRGEKVKVETKPAVPF